RMTPSARRVARAIRKPLASTAASVSRLGWQPPVRRVHSGWMRSSSRARHGTGERTCSIMRSSPAAASTRRISAKPRLGFPTRQTHRRATGSARYLARPGSGGEDDEDTRIGVEEVPASDRRELTVAEEAGERERSQVLLDQRDVVVRNPVQPLATPGAIEVAT